MTEKDQTDVELSRKAVAQRYCQNSEQVRKMVLTADNNIAVSPPMKRISSLVRFAALNRACSFAESIIEKYSSFNEEYKTFDSFVFLRSFNEALRQEEMRESEMMLAVRLMISRQLVITRRIDLTASDMIYPAAAELRISEISSRLRTTDHFRWRLLRELQKTIENEELFSRYISTNEIFLETHKEATSVVDIGGIFNYIQLTSSGEGFHGDDNKYFLPERTLVFRRDKLDIDIPDDRDHPAAGGPCGYYLLANR